MRTHIQKSRFIMVRITSTFFEPTGIMYYFIFLGHSLSVLLLTLAGDKRRSAGSCFYTWFMQRRHSAEKCLGHVFSLTRTCGFFKLHSVREQFSACFSTLDMLAFMKGICKISKYCRLEQFSTFYVYYSWHMPPSRESEISLPFINSFFGSVLLFSSRENNLIKFIPNHLSILVD